ncbi:hypothetical protein BABINDRAFT_9465 [Babjeviella inositovora NRRL Y-12698]|uniref:Transcription factor domain-containing protein n=1 Tax=Babjeviella inositovora NRRL Y-12698 TaxID=984486 RepID=A0A1E3QMC9_9ASCO|nr:uncharacterized protein BABINDRAFT_9465 [Babjeviella inositovora NRRL Y-12698]ODQ78242.1 hypothetical protein BABINDRAFT_9465 [Babjeviella inositovora NRRL Y-12698]
MKNNPTENPWRTLSLPLVQKYPVVYSAISPITCFHIARSDDDIRAAGMGHMRDAVIRSEEGLKEESPPADMALVTCLALAVSVCWNCHISTGITHLKGAKKKIRQVLSTLNRVRPVYTPKSVQFLLNCWMYFEVMALITSEGDNERLFLQETTDTEGDRHRRTAEVEDSAWDLPSCIALTGVYRYAMLLYLHQAAPELPSLLSHEPAEKMLTFLASIPTHTSYLYPLFIASCEAAPGDEREWAQQR